MDCKLYCMFISAFSVFFLLYLFFLVAVGSETLYIPVHSRLASSFALLVSAFIYGAIFAYLYYNKFVNVDRKAELRKWIEEQRKQRKNMHEMRQFDRQSKLLSVAREMEQ